MRDVARALLLSTVIILVAFVGFAYWSGNSYWRYPMSPGTSGAVGTSGVLETAAAKVGETVDEAALTSKIKAKMVLDDSVKARKIDVSTNDSTVTLSGVVGSQAEHDRALALARETDGVTQVIDRLRIGEF
jgi:hyperosmotically inducible protein